MSVLWNHLSMFCIFHEMVSQVWLQEEKRKRFKKTEFIIFTAWLEREALHAMRESCSGNTEGPVQPSSWGNLARERTHRQLLLLGLQRVRHDWATELNWTEGRIHKPKALEDFLSVECHLIRRGKERVLVVGASLIKFVYLAPWVEAHSFCLFTAVGITHRNPPSLFLNHYFV